MAAWLCGLVVACGDEATVVSPAPGGGGNGGGAGAAGAAGASGSAGASGAPSSPVNEDELALQACQAPEPCAEGGVQMVEASSFSLRDAETRCVLDALAQRRPGRYRYNTESAHTGGHVGARHLLLLSTGGSVQYVRTEYESLMPAGNAVRPDRGQRCVLKPGSYFEGCSTAVAARTQPTGESFPQPLWGCVFGDGSATTASHLDWFESCVEESPSACDAGGYVPADAGAGDPDAASPDAGDAG